MKTKETGVRYWLRRCGGTCVLLAALAASACSGSGPGETASSLGADLFKVQGCATCHGNEGQGSMLGPALRGLKQHWTREQLVEYFVDPQAFAAKDPRLAKQGKGFIQSMPGYKALKPEERASLADLVLGWP
jgi:mono/diheme cytochrome c family protein